MSSPAIVIDAPPSETGAGTGTSASTQSATTRPNFQPGSALDLVFCLDCTGSMGSYIHSATNSIKAVVEAIVKSEKADLRFALVAYRDHPPQDQSFITKVYPFTKYTAEMKSYLDQLSASGGGDGPEAVTAALNELLTLPWREGAAKQCVFIADAPPHGLERNGDGFPNGDPEGRDPLAITRQLAQMGVCVFPVACEPTLSTSYEVAADFFRAVANMTGGIMVPLSEANLLPEVIVGGAAEVLALERILASQREAVEQTRGQDDRQRSAALYDMLKTQGVKTKKLNFDEVYQKSEVAERNQVLLSNAISLQAAKSNLTPVPGSERLSNAPAMEAPGGGSFYSKSASKSKRSAGSAHLAAASPAFAAAPSVRVEEESEVSMEQVTRLVTMSKSRGF